MSDQEDSLNELALYESYFDQNSETDLAHLMLIAAGLLVVNLETFSQVLYSIIAIGWLWKHRDQVFS